MSKAESRSTLYAVEPDGTKTDAWVFEELLGDDPLDPDYTHVVGSVDLYSDDQPRDESGRWTSEGHAAPRLAKGEPRPGSKRWYTTTRQGPPAVSREQAKRMGYTDGPYYHSSDYVDEIERDGFLSRGAEKWEVDDIGYMEDFEAWGSAHPTMFAPDKKHVIEDKVAGVNSYGNDVIEVWAKPGTVKSASGKTLLGGFYVSDPRDVIPIKGTKEQARAVREERDPVERVQMSEVVDPARRRDLYSDDQPRDDHGRWTDTQGTTGVAFEQRGEWGKVGTKKDGSKVLLTEKPLSEALRQRIFGTNKVEDIVGQMVEDLPGHLQVSVGQSGNDTVVSVRVTGADGLEMQRYFRRNTVTGELEVHHQKFEIPAKLRGQGVAKAVLADAVHAYQQMGAASVTMTANMDVGSYAWAKYGFKAKVPTNMASDLDAQLNIGHPRKAEFPTITLTERRALQQIIADHANDPKLPWHLAGAKAADGRQIGKELLLNQAWGAVLRLDDPEAMARFNHYVEGH